MKTFITILLVLISAITAEAQITLTSNISPVPGDIQLQVRVDTNGIGIGGTGANQVWSYQNIIRQDSTTIQWLDPSQTPYGSQFPASNICALDTCYNYFNASASAFQFVGYFSQGTAIHYADFETLLTFPFTFNSTFTDNFAAAISMNGDVIIRTGTVNGSGDAWGTIFLPFGTFTNSLRVKEIIAIKDSSTLYHQSIYTTYTTYEWYVPGKKFSVFKIVYININIPGLYNISRKNVFDNPGSIAIGITQISSHVPQSYSLSQNYPNPFNPSTKINFDVPRSGQVNLVIYDMLGREVGRPVDEFLKPGIYSVDFNAASLSSGTYFYTMSTLDYTQTKRMVLVK